MAGWSGIGVRLRSGVAWLLLVAVAAACDDMSGLKTGQIEVTVTTTGADVDPDGYSLSLDGVAGLTLPVNATRP